MVATDINGKKIAASIRQEIQDRLVSEEFSNTAPPGLAVILVGDRRDSQTYVKMKQKACNECGIVNFGYTFPISVSEEEIIDCIERCNANPAIHGILVQLPLPPQIREELILTTVDPEKDVDGLHPLNVAQLTSTNTHTSSTTQRTLDWKKLKTIPFSIPCTPQGCIELLDRSGVELEGARVVVIGRSNLVGIPVLSLLLHRNATVTVVHSKTRLIESIVKEADVVIVAVGKPSLVKAEWLKKGAVVIDVGINSIPDSTKKKGYKLVGDVDYQNCKQVASQITPVPGGVGPMTIAMLLRNTVNACQRQQQQQQKEEPILLDDETS